MRQISIYFDLPKSFDPDSINLLGGIAGLYFIFTESIKIEYPFGQSRLIYIGMSEKKTNSIGTRLTGHYGGLSKNIGLKNYRRNAPLFFTYLNFEVLRPDWNRRIEDLESYFIADFVSVFGVYPICNNKGGQEIEEDDLNVEFKIDWKYFK